MSNLIIELQPSKTYLLLSVGVYFLCLLAIWYYLPQLALGLGLSGFLSIWFWYFLRKNVFWKQASVCKIGFTNEQITLEKNDKSSKKYSMKMPVFQSPFLIIFKFSKQPLVIFKDACKNQSLSSINRICRAKC
ncbi:MAG: hypothetical protein HAW58_00900 [Candidatus Thioglobus sp.]|nr:hypothetical protein [Candidatus Thioglobus sp.]